MMLFGFLIVDLLFFLLFPFVLLCLLWADVKGWAAAITVIVLAIVGIKNRHAVGDALSDPVFMGDLIKYIVGFIGIGAVFSFLKWKMLTVKAAKAFSLYLDRNSGSEKVRTLLASNWNGGTTGNNYYRVLSVVPKEGGGWTTKYAKITLAEYVTSWIIYWPFYALLLVIDDLLRHLVDWFVEVFGKAYQKLGDQSFSSIK